MAQHKTHKRTPQGKATTIARKTHRRAKYGSTTRRAK